NCGLFKTQLRLVDFNECRNVHNEFEMLNISKRTHLCLRPVQNSRTNLSGPNNCQRCLIASSSVLHVEQANGSVCVLGIATPTMADCIQSEGPLYYLGIVT
ncbi:CG15046, partial [Drosophila busckii]